MCCFLFHVNANYFYFSFLKEIESYFFFCQINDHILYTQGYVNLLQQRYQLWYSGYHKDYYWVEFTIVHYLSSRSVWFCRGHSCELNGNRMCITISIYFGYLFAIIILIENNRILKILFRPVDGAVSVSSPLLQL